MTQRIWKYTLTTTSDNTIEMPIGATKYHGLALFDEHKAPKWTGKLEFVPEELDRLRRLKIPFVAHVPLILMFL